VTKITKTHSFLNCCYCEIQTKIFTKTLSLLKLTNRLKSLRDCSNHADSWFLMYSEDKNKRYRGIKKPTLHSGQKLNDEQIVAEKNLDPNAPWSERLLVKHRRLIGILIPFVAFQVGIQSVSCRTRLVARFQKYNKRGSCL